MGEQTAIVIIGDVIQSKTTPDRALLQDRLRTAIGHVNQISKPASRFTISAGDEVEAVYTTGQTLLNDLWIIQARIFPCRMRYSVGVGPIATPMNARNPLVMDGAAFHLARKGIVELKKERELIAIKADEAVNVDLEHNAARLLAHHVRAWKKNRLEIYERFLAGRSEQQIATEIDISLTAVYKNVTGGRLELVDRLSRDISGSLAKLVRN